MSVAETLLAEMLAGGLVGSAGGYGKGFTMSAASGRASRDQRPEVRGAHGYRVALSGIGLNLRFTEQP